MPQPEEAEPQRESDPDALAKALELELIMKRASWEKRKARRSTWRSLSFLFLFLIILGALVAYFYLMTNARQHGEERAPSQVQSSR
jgi:cytoskeletal protein RodZ